MEYKCFPIDILKIALYNEQALKEQKGKKKIMFHVHNFTNDGDISNYKSKVGINA